MGNRLVRLWSSFIVVGYLDSDGAPSTRRYPVQRVSLTHNGDLDSGSMMIFYGRQNSEFIAENRLWIGYGRRDIVRVAEILATGTGADSYQSVGQFRWARR